MFVDYPSVSSANIQTENTEGAAVGSGSAWTIPLVIPDTEVAELISEYDPSASASPSAANSRIIARLIMDALLKATA